MGCKAENSVMVGNSFNDDILGAIDSGMSAIFLTHGLKESESEIIEKRNLKLNIISNIGEIKDIM
jgi:putative hydrolase of the HAD superfamily